MALGNPQMTASQQQGTAVQGFIDALTLHLPFGLPKVRKGCGHIALPHRQLGQTEVAMKRTWIATGEGMFKPTLQRCLRFIRTVLAQLQTPQAQFKPRQHRRVAQGGRRSCRQHPLQQRFGTGKLTARFQQQGVIQFQQGFKHWVAMQACLLQGFKTEFLCHLQLTFANGYQGQCRTAQQRLRPRALRQPLQSIMQVGASIHGTDSAVGNDALDGLPVSEQLTGSRAIAARLKTCQLIDTGLRLIQTADQQQHPGVEQNQPRRTAQQAVR